MRSARRGAGGQIVNGPSARDRQDQKIVFDADSEVEWSVALESSSAAELICNLS